MANLDSIRAQYEQSLFSVAESMKTCAKLAEAYAYAIKKASGSELLLNGVSDDSDVPPNKSKKPKSTVDDEPVESGKRKREKKPKDPNAPKRPASSYILYQNEVRPQLKEKYPDLNIGDLRKLMSEEWAAMSNEDKERYNKLASDAKKNYSEAKRAYDARSPDEVAAANAAAASAAATKKPRQSKPKADKAEEKNNTVAKKTAPKVEVASPEGSEEEEEEESSDEEEPKKTVPLSDDEEDEEEEDEEDEPEDAPPAKKHKSKPVSSSKDKRKKRV